MRRSVWRSTAFGTTHTLIVLVLSVVLAALVSGCVSFQSVDPTNADALVDVRVPQGEVRTLENVRMPELDRSRDVYVYLPPGYTQSDTRYPVLYMQDGQNLFDGIASPNRHWMVDRIIDAHVAMGLYDGLIVVGVRSNAYRVSEYVPYNFSYGETTYDNTRAADYSDFLAETLKPLIDQQFRTLPDREHTHIAGSSFGAFISLYSMMRHPDVYGGVGAFSSAVWPADFAFIEAIRSYDGRTDTRLYLDMGTWEGADPVEQTRIMAAAFRDLGFDELQVVIEPQGVHTESAWRGRFPGAILWLLDRQAVQP